MGSTLGKSCGCVVGSKYAAEYAGAAPVGSALGVLRGFAVGLEVVVLYVGYLCGVGLGAMRGFVVGSGELFLYCDCCLLISLR